ncbi:uncharacterized protein EI90DRAFT_1730794 [Cantharellus anzutake]|uniref:uncharacterized protein n=1 Tax=Cantharellus anzutake TaxID=1750568 RepID=UPI0019085388|nr:uncharacterized protein EI90DRAFT_1730794 [Cantharellus anzutake]KAF8341386.1 hypothetical protein EI90DRAFT_1730794 [Cantharellus anzutake]
MESFRLLLGISHILLCLTHLMQRAKGNTANHSLNAASKGGSAWDGWIIIGGHDPWVNSVLFSSNGFRIASAFAHPSARIWDAVIGDELKVLRGHAYWVTSTLKDPS